MSQQFKHDPTLPGGKDVVCEIRDGIAFVSLNRPEKRNCISPGIVNDANDWAVETMGNPRYPLELFQRVVTVSLETMNIVRALPQLEILSVAN